MLRFPCLFVVVLLVMSMPIVVSAFPQCPAVGLNTGCRLLITVTAVNSSGAATAFTVTVDSAQAATYEGSEDTLFGIQNNSGSPLTSITLNSNTDAFGFDGDGLCSVSPRPSGCTPGPLSAGDTTGYGGPGVTFSNITNSPVASCCGTVNFSPAVASGGSAYFGLEEALTPSSIVPPPAVPVPPTIILAVTGL